MAIAEVALVFATIGAVVMTVTVWVHARMAPWRSTKTLGDELVTCFLLALACMLLNQMLTVGFWGVEDAPALLDNPVCYVQSVVHTVSATAARTYALATVVNLWMRLTRHSIPPRFRAWAHGLSLGLPVALTATLHAINTPAAKGAGRLFCWISDPGALFAVVFAPSLVLSIGAVVFAVLSLRRLRRSAEKAMGGPVPVARDDGAQTIDEAYAREEAGAAATPSRGGAATATASSARGGGERRSPAAGSEGGAASPRGISMAHQPPTTPLGSVRDAGVAVRETVAVGGGGVIRPSLAQALTPKPLRRVAPAGPTRTVLRKKQIDSMAVVTRVRRKLGWFFGIYSLLMAVVLVPSMRGVLAGDSETTPIGTFGGEEAGQTFVGILMFLVWGVPKIMKDGLCTTGKVGCGRGVSAVAPATGARPPPIVGYRLPALTASDDSTTQSPSVAANDGDGSEASGASGHGSEAIAADRGVPGSVVVAVAAPPA
mmetsp:Transcript_9068/g.32031  ORF Transcript_9068/g.32031 Transcript_9068/m.32031 type:complete len:486 (-) Transcript_9068:85-1542(-)